ncbi:TauD/TfdA family dioxygenase [Streptomyces malaysiensis]|uniref:TauD/TfdA family dioxygenase n=1 Tax=Streptomyces malaysiensis TaxID=92644 RepID=UPI000BFF2DCE|nr:TauD/TfdA family dioxygenase [Streptomyces malaysiensis]ATL82949.1 taurine catabolism dioxygenase TauD/TfdA [Streptomyces malaysiensis]
MRHAAAAPVAPFSGHYVNIRAPRASDTIAAQLRETGLVTVDGLHSRQNILALASRLMAVTPHPHGAPDGLTLIRDTGSHSRRAGFAGLGSGDLQAHTERSGIPRPPRLMLLVCRRPAPAGGDVLLADGRDVHTRLVHSCRAAAIAFSQPRTAYFGSGTGHATQVITTHADGRISIRLRQDGLARWSPHAQPYLPRLRAAITDSQHRITLQAGQGYLLDNHRWLHARTRFSGDRQFLRALGEPHFSLPEGFIPLPSAAPLGRAAPESLCPHRSSRGRPVNNIPGMTNG